MLSTITLVISGKTKICDIDMLLTVGTSSLFINVMQTVHVHVGLINKVDMVCLSPVGYGV